MSFKGMDPDQLRAFAGHLHTASQTLHGSQQRVASQLGSLAWLGSFADRFRGDWNGVHKQHMNAVATHLQTLSEQIMAEVQQQEAASGAQSAGSNYAMGVGSLTAAGGPRIRGFLGSILAPHIPLALRGGTWVPMRSDLRKAFHAENVALFSVIAPVVGVLSLPGKFDRRFMKISEVEKDAGRFVHSPWRKALAQNPIVKASGTFRHLKAVEAVGHIADVQSAALGGAKIGTDLGKGHYKAALGSTYDTAGDVMTDAKNPAVRLGGYNMRIWGGVVSSFPAFRESLHHPIPHPSPFSHDGREIYGNTAKDVATGVYNIVMGHPKK